VALIHHLKRCGFSYVIRSGGNTSIEHARLTRGDAGPHHRAGSAARPRERALAQNRSVETRVVAFWDKGQAKPWCLTTDLTLLVRAIARLYGKRFHIEETFRDQKSSRLEFALSKLTTHSAERLGKLLLTVVFAPLLALSVGAIAKQRGGRWLPCHHRPPTTLTLGLYYLWRISWTLRELIKIRALEPCSPFGDNSVGTIASFNLAAFFIYCGSHQ
jgi:hypothetical protein